ncbi:hypothetical protein FP803_00145 [Candidatus Woesearchaeota archaeon]|nr:hypothetical protein [Candidatus Woesearchaeota archaeon]
MNFIKKIYEKNVDEKVHKKFVRYSTGEFEKEEFMIKKGSSFVQIKAGFEYLDVMFDLMARCVNEDVSLNGIIITKNKIINELNEFGIEPKKVTGKKYTIQEIMNKKKFKEFVEKFNSCFLLLNLKSGKYSISVKKSIPKPGKLVEKFVTAKFDLKDLDLIKKEFLFDIKADNFKDISIKHTYIIDEIIIPEGFKNNPEEARLNAKRKGRIIRKIEIDGKVEEKEMELLA